MNEKILAVILMLVLLTIVFAGCNEEKTTNPEGEIISEYTSSNNDIDNFKIFVNLTVKNNGDAGNLKVWAYVRQGLTDEEKSQTLYFNHDETKNISFAFSEGFELGSGWFHDYGVN